MIVWSRKQIWGKPEVAMRSKPAGNSNMLLIDKELVHYARIASASIFRISAGHNFNSSPDRSVLPTIGNVASERHPRHNVSRIRQLGSLGADQT
jgi:hypothetical protein